MTCRMMQRAAVLVSILGAAAPALGDVIEVGVVGTTFIPADVKINVGDTVHWAWKGEPMPHNVESGVGGAHDGNFRSGDPVTSEDYSVVFDQAFLDANPMPDNSYPYYCIVHVFEDMIGSVTVNKEAIIPTVSEWGLIVMALLLLTAGTIMVARRRRPAVT